MTTPKGTLPTVGIALIPVAALVVAMALAILVFEQDPHIPLIFAAAIAALTARTQGYTWSNLEEGMLAGVRIGLKAILILLIIGILIALWIAAGVVPYLISLGLELLHPRIFLFASCLICAVVSLVTGSSWTTAGTVGVALMGIGAGLDMSLPMVAGAIVSGAYFGDKMSPLSDTTNLAPAVTGVDLFTHIRHMMYTTAPAFALALVLYGAIGFTVELAATDDAAIEAMQATLGEHYSFHPILLLAPLVVVVLSARKVAAIPVLIVAAAIGGVMALLMQGTPPGEIIGLAHYGYESETGHEEVDALLSRGGMESMLYTVSLILCALSFGGIMERARMIEKLAMVILHGVRTSGGLVTSTVVTSIGMNITVPDQYLAIVVPGRMYGPAFAERGLHAKNLSRTLEDAGTLTSPLVPWNTCGATMMGVLAISPLAYLPFAFFNLLTPVIAIAWAYRGIAQAPLDAE